MSKHPVGFFYEITLDKAHKRVYIPYIVSFSHPALGTVYCDLGGVERGREVVCALRDGASRLLRVRAHIKMERKLSAVTVNPPIIRRTDETLSSVRRKRDCASPLMRRSLGAERRPASEGSYKSDKIRRAENRPGGKRKCASELMRGSLGAGWRRPASEGS